MGGPRRLPGCPYLVKDQEGDTKCVSCQLCEFICPPKAIKITPPGPDGPPADRANAEKMPREFEINMLRCIFCGLCQEVCPEEAIFLQRDYSLTGTSREAMVYNKEKLLELGGIHGGIQKWKQKLEEAREQESFPRTRPKNPCPGSPTSFSTRSPDWPCCSGSFASPTHGAGIR